MTVATIISGMANLGVTSIVSKALSTFKAPISKHVVVGTCETIGIFCAAEMAGYMVGKYTKNQIEDFKKAWTGELVKPDAADQAGTDEKEVENG